MPRHRTGRTPKPREWRITYLQEGVETVKYTKRKPNELTTDRQQGEVKSIEVTKWQAAFWGSDGQLVFVTTGTRDEADHLLRTKGTARESSPDTPYDRVLRDAERTSDVACWTLSRYTRWLLATGLLQNSIQQATYNVWSDLLRTQLEGDQKYGGAQMASGELRQINWWSMQQYISRRSAAAKVAGKGGATVQHLYGFLKHIWGVASVDPDFVDLPKIVFRNDSNPFTVSVSADLVKVRVERLFGEEEIENIIKACEDEFDRAMFGLALCDLRPPGEIIGVRKIDLDIDNGLLWVRGQVRCERDLEGRHRRIYKDRTKTGSKDPRLSVPIPIPDRALPLICSTFHLNSEFVIPTPRHRKSMQQTPREPMHPRTASYRWSNLLKRAGVDHRRFYVMRHTITNEISKRTSDIKTIQHLGGWASPITPLRHYLRVDEVKSRRVMKSIAALAAETSTLDDLMAAVEASPCVFKMRVLQYLLNGGVMESESTGLPRELLHANRS